MNLVDGTELGTAAFFDAMVNEDQYRELFGFDWDAEFAAASVPPEPWLWDWKSPLRAQLEHLTGTSDVTGWTQGAGSRLAAVLAAPQEMHASLLGFREAETGLLPVVVAPLSGDSPDTPATSAAGDGQPLPLP